MITLWVAFYLGHLWHFGDAFVWWMVPATVTCIIFGGLECILEVGALISYMDYIEKCRRDNP